MRVPIQLWSTTATWRMRGLRVWSDRRTLPTLSPKKIFRIFSAELCVNVSRPQLLSQTCKLQKSLLLQEDWRLLECAVVDHLMEIMVTRCKLYIELCYLTCEPSKIPALGFFEVKPINLCFMFKTRTIFIQILCKLFHKI